MGHCRAYLTLQGMCFLGPGHLQIFGQRSELVALCPVVVVTGQGLGPPGMDQGHHVPGQVALSLAAGRLLPVPVLTLQLAHPLAVPQPRVIVHTPHPNELATLLHKLVPIEKLKGTSGWSGASAHMPTSQQHGVNLCPQG